MTQKELTYFFINPTSGKGTARSIFKKHKRTFSDRFGEILFIDSLADLDEKVTHADLRRIIIIGGDGTIHQVVNSILHKRPKNFEKLAIGIVAAGTGSDFIRSIGGGVSAEKDIMRIIGGRPQPLDIGRVIIDKSEKFFINSASLGLGGYACGRQMSWHKKYLPTSLSYLVPGLHALYEYQPQNLSIKIKNNCIFKGKCWGVMVYNGPFSGGGMKWAPLAHSSDGQLDLLIKPLIPYSKVLPAAASLVLNKIDKFSDFIFKHTEEVSIEALDNMLLPCELDGEYFEGKRYDFSVLKNYIYLLRT